MGVPDTLGRSMIIRCVRGRDGANCGARHLLVFFCPLNTHTELTAHIYGRFVGEHIVAKV